MYWVQFIVCNYFVYDNLMSQENAQQLQEQLGDIMAEKQGKMYMSSVVVM